MPESLSVTMASVWINGTSLQGQVAEVEFPEFERNLEKQEGIGLGGVVAHPTTLKELELKLKFSDFSADAMAYAADHRSNQVISVYFNVQVDDGLGEPEDRPLSHHYEGKFYNYTSGKFKHGEPLEGTAEMMVYEFRQKYSDEKDTIINVKTGKHIVRGRDITSAERRNAAIF